MQARNEKKRLFSKIDNLYALVLTRMHVCGKAAPLHFIRETRPSFAPAAAKEWKNGALFAQIFLKNFSKATKSEEIDKKF